MPLTSKLSAIADAIRAQDGTTTTMKLDEMPERILNIGTGSEWHRPASWPDLDAAYAAHGDGDVVFFTVDESANETIGFGTQRSSGNWVLERGHLESGKFVSDEQVYSGGSDITYQAVSGTGIAVYRATPTSGKFMSAFLDSSSASCPTPCRDCHVYEIVGRCSYIATSWSRESYTQALCSNRTKRWKLDLSWTGEGTRSVDFNRMFIFDAGVECIDCSGWDCSTFKATTTAYMFDFCTSLISLDMSGWDTSGWAVTTTAYMFGYCTSLISLDMNGWDTSNWAVTTTAYMFYFCTSLISLDMNGWDTSNWAVTTMAYMFGYCTSLISLDMSGWDTSGWAVTTTAYMFYWCASLQFGAIALPALSVSLSFSPDLTHELLAATIALLPTVTTACTLTLHAYAKARLTSEDTAAITAKGWKVA